jgi:hypothetical protein
MSKDRCSFQRADVLRIRILGGMEPWAEKQNSACYMDQINYI